MSFAQETWLARGGNTMTAINQINSSAEGKWLVGENGAGDGRFSRHWQSDRHQAGCVWARRLAFAAGMSRR